MPFRTAKIPRQKGAAHLHALRRRRDLQLEQLVDLRLLVRGAVIEAPEHGLRAQLEHGLFVADQLFHPAPPLGEVRELGLRQLLCVLQLLDLRRELLHRHEPRRLLVLVGGSETDALADLAEQDFRLPVRAVRARPPPAR
jgi:hypothetical protein